VKKVVTPTVNRKPVGGEKNGGSRVKDSRPKWYPTEDVKKPRSSHKTPGTTRLRQAITPGTILILLGGRFQGKRVVFLKQLPSGLLLVTGPHKLNGVPLRRVDQAYVIGTSTKIDISGVKIPEAINDAFFNKPATKKKAKTQEEFFTKEAEVKKEVSRERKDLQKAVDSSIEAALKKDEMLAKYIKARFRLTSKQFPHEMVF